MGVHFPVPNTSDLTDQKLANEMIANKTNKCWLCFKLLPYIIYGLIMDEREEYMTVESINVLLK